MKLFKTFRLDTGNHLLGRNGDRVPLAPKAFDLLAYLVEHAGRLVTQDEILEALWSETYVNPEVLRKYILESLFIPIFEQTQFVRMTLLRRQQQKQKRTSLAAKREPRLKRAAFPNSHSEIH